MLHEVNMMILATGSPQPIWKCRSKSCLWIYWFNNFSKKLYYASL